MSFFAAEVLSICATRVPLACANLLWAIAAEIPSFSQFCRVIARPLCAI